MGYPKDGAAPGENAERRQRVEALLLDGELYFATARELNDPFEAAPHFRIRGVTPDATLQAVSQALRDIYGPRWGWDEQRVATRTKALADEIRSGEFHARMAGLADKWRDWFRAEFPMCCLAATRDSTLMWSYYSGGHSGVCIHIDASKAPFANAGRVVYSEEYPELQIPLAEVEPVALLTLALLTKSRVWSHEREYRLINMPLGQPKLRRILDDVFRWKAPQLAIVPPLFITGITIGASMQSAEIETMLRICHDRQTKIPVFQAKCGKDRFDLEFVPLT
jgi:hypothetical protein